MKRIVRMALGTFVSIAVYRPHRSDIEEIIKSAFKVIERIEACLSIFRKNSEVSTLNKFGILENPSEDCYHVFKKAYEYSELTQGVFDVSILPHLAQKNIVKSLDGLKKSSSEVESPGNYRDIDVGRDSIRFKKAGMGVTLGAIAKGYAVDETIDFLVENGIKSAIVNAGGDIRGIGSNPECNDWVIGIKDPTDKKSVLRKVKLNNNKALATSGVYQRQKGDIFDGKSKEAPNGTVSATTVAKRAIDADALSTSLYMLGHEEGFKIVDGIQDAAGLIVSRNGKIYKSRNWRRYEAPEYSNVKTT